MNLCAFKYPFIPQENLRKHQKSVPVEIETRSLEEVRELIDLYDSGKAEKVTRIMLDNMAHLDPLQAGKCFSAHLLLFPTLLYEIL